MAQQSRMPDLEKQRVAMKELAFLEGKWAGEARALRPGGETVTMTMSEEAQYKLGGLVLMIEGVGRTNSNGPATLQALGMISYDDISGTYHLRAFNDGRFLESQVKLLGEGHGMTWGFSVGEFKTHAVLRINEKGEWTEQHELIIGQQPPRKLMELNVRRQR
jgi:hypothetical protein